VAIRETTSEYVSYVSHETGIAETDGLLRFCALLLLNYYESAKML
jgi:hypothetical protein